MHRFSDAADIWLAKVRDPVENGKRSPGTVNAYSRKLEAYVCPALDELRLGEITTPLVDRVIGKIKTDVGGATAKLCRTVVSGKPWAPGPSDGARLV